MLQRRLHKLRRVSCAAFSACFLLSVNAFAVPSSPARPGTTRPAVEKPAVEKPTTPRKQPLPGVATDNALRTTRSERAPSRPSILGVGIGLGSNATFGNALTVHLAPFSFFEARGGIGYNTTGGKFGAGAGLNLPIGGLGVGLGAAFVRSGGNTGNVSVPAKFTPEGSSTTESVTAIRRFKVTPSSYYSIYADGHLNFAEALRLELAVNWNKVISGNEIEFTGPMEYSVPLEVQNEEDVQPKFETNARKKLDINGAGFSVGLQLRL